MEIPLLGTTGGFFPELGFEAQPIEHLDDVVTVVCKAELKRGMRRTGKAKGLPRTLWVLGRVDHYNGSSCKCGILNGVSVYGVVQEPNKKGSHLRMVSETALFHWYKRTKEFDQTLSTSVGYLKKASSLQKQAV